MKVIIFAILSLVVTLCYSVPEWIDICRKKGSGRYCRNDLSGWIQCSGSSWFGLKLHKDVDCPASTKCSCYVGNNCHTIRGPDFKPISDEQVCKPMDRPHPVKPILHMRYRREGWENFDPYEDDVIYSERGEVMQDAQRRSLLKIWKDRVEKTSHLELIVPDGEDGAQFTKFSIKYPIGEQPTTCRKVKLARFTNFTDGIRSFQPNLGMRTRPSLRFEQQVWENKIFHYHGEPGTVERWTVLADLKSKVIHPLKYYSSYVGTQEEQCCGHEITTYYENVHVDSNTDTVDWFKIPNVCL